MKKRLWIATLSAFTLLCVVMFVIVACNKNPDDGNEGGGGNSLLQAPSGIVAEESHSMVCVYWDDVSGACFYKVYRADRSNGTYFWMSDVDGNMYWDDDPMQDNYYKVSAVDEEGEESAMSSYAYCSCENCGGNGGGGGGGGSTSIEAPTGVEANVSGLHIRVSWDYVYDASSYRIYRSSSSYGSYSFLGSSNYSYYIDSDPMSENYYKVSSVGSDGSESAMSSYAYCQYSGGGGGGGSSAPDAPTGLDAYNAGSTAVPNVKISWNSVSGATSYKVYRSSSPGSGYSQIGSETSWNYLYDSNPRNGNNYYKVKAFNSAGSSSYSDYVLFYFDANGYEPCPPHTLTGSATSTGSSSARITLRWTFSTTGGCGTPTKIHVRVMDPDSNSGIEVDNSPFSGSATSCTFTIGYLPAWNMGSGWIMMGVAGENDHGTSNYKTISYNYLTNEWR